MNPIALFRGATTSAFRSFVVVIISLLTTWVSAQPPIDDRYILTSEGTASNRGGINYTITLDSSSGDEVFGLSFGVCYDAADLDLLQVEPSPILQDWNGSGPEVVAFNESLGSVDFVTVFCGSCPNARLLQPVADFDLLNLHFDTLVGPLTSVLVELCDSPAEEIFLIDSAGPRIPVVTSSPVVTSDVIPFIRGDADGDGAVQGLQDAFFLLHYGFLGGPAPACLEAADVNNDGSCSVFIDAYSLLQYQFMGGLPPAAPFPSCGLGSGVYDCESSPCP